MAKTESKTYIDCLTCGKGQLDVDGRQTIPFQICETGQVRVGSGMPSRRYRTCPNHGTAWTTVQSEVQAVKDAKHYGPARFIEAKSTKSGRRCSAVCTNGKIQCDCRCEGRCHGAGSCLCNE